MNIISRKAVLIQLGLAIALTSGPIAAEEWRQRIEVLAASDVKIVSVKSQKNHVVVRGTAANTTDVSTFMRRLANQVGSPSLNMKARADKRSEFTMRFKKPAS